MTLYPTISQITFYGVGDIDECSIIAMYWAAKAAGYKGDLPTIAVFRQAAGVPDAPGPTGLTVEQVGYGIAGTVLKSAGALVMTGVAWSDFATSVKSGATASVALNSALLPTSAHFGFLGAHSVGVQYVNGQWYIANPLAPNNSAPLPISEVDLKKAIAGFSGDKVLGILFKGQGSATATAQPVWSGPAFLAPPTIPAVAGIAAFPTHYNDARLTAEFYRAKHAEARVWRKND